MRVKINEMVLEVIIFIAEAAEDEGIVRKPRTCLFHILQTIVLIPLLGWNIKWIRSDDGETQAKKIGKYLSWISMILSESSFSFLFFAGDGISSFSSSTSTSTPASPASSSNCWPLNESISTTL